MKNEIISARSAKRVVDYPEFYGGGWDLISGRYHESGKYAKSPWAFACLQIRGSELAALPWRITKNGEEIKNHPLVKMLTEFGPESNYFQAIQSTEIDRCLTGSAFWLRDYDQLKRLNPKNIEVKTNRSGITGFIQRFNGKVINKFQRDEITYFREYHPDTDLEPGTPVMDVIKLAIAQEYEASKFVEAFFQNDATPSLLLSTDQAVSASEAEKILAWWRKKFQGRRKSHQPGLADRGMKAQILSHSLREIALVEIRDQARGDICAGLRTPMLLVGAMTEATYANAQEARKFMIEDFVIPRSRDYADVINADLVQKVDPSVKFEFVTENLPILQENATSKWERLNAAATGGIITPEFVRQQMGWPETAAPIETDEVNPVARSWKRKATRAFKRGEGAAVPFETDEIPMPEQLRIRSKLEQAGSLQDIERAFIDD